MSMSYQEAMYEQAMEDLYAEHKEQVLEEFPIEQLQSFFMANATIVEPPLYSLAEARRLLASHHTAAHVFAAVAVEVGLKMALVKPVVYCVVHSDSAANVIAELAIRNIGNRGHRTGLLQILSAFGGIDLKTFKRAGSQESLWQEIEEVKQRRDIILRRAEIASEEQAEQAIAVAAAILDDIFPSVIKQLGLPFHVHESGRVCKDYNCEVYKTESEARMAEVARRVKAGESPSKVIVIGGKTP